MLASAMLSWCIMMGKMTEQAELDKRQGMTQQAAYVKSQMHLDPRLREAGALITEYVYRLNNDDRMSPREMRGIVQHVCENPPNALSGTAPTPQAN